MAQYDFETMCRAVEEVIRSETAALVESERADVQIRPGDMGTADVTPRNPGASPVSVCTQSEDEVSLWPKAPGTDRAPTGDIFNGDSETVLVGLREYLAAVFAGRIELTLARKSSAARCRFWLGDGTCKTHLYSGSDVWMPFGFLVGRGSGWETFRPEPY